MYKELNDKEKVEVLERLLCMLTRGMFNNIMEVMYYVDFDENKASKICEELWEIRDHYSRREYKEDK